MASPSPSGARWPPRRSRTPRRTTSPSSSWFASAYAPDEAAAESGFPALVAATWDRSAVLRYGENPHQRAALYTAPDVPGALPGLAQATQLHGKEMSYNNYVDSDAAWRAAHDHAEPAVAVVKHANPCGIAVGTDVADAHAKAHACDPVSAYGSVVAANRPVTAAMAEQLAPVFTEVVLAPGVRAGGARDPDPQEERPAAASCPARRTPPRSSCARSAAGCWCSRPTGSTPPGDDPSTWTLAAGEPADEATLADLAFAWRAVRAAKSNAILLAARRRLGRASAWAR